MLGPAAEMADAMATSKRDSKGSVVVGRQRSMVFKVGGRSSSVIGVPFVTHRKNVCSFK